MKYVYSMVDPIIGAIAGAMAGQATEKALSHVGEAFSRSDDERETWNKIARECAIKAEVAYCQHVHDLPVPDYDRSQGIAASVGEVAQDLAVRGKRRGYDEEDVQLVRDLAQACAVYSNSSIQSGMEVDPEDEYKEAVDKLSEQIFEMVDE